MTMMRKLAASAIAAIGLGGCSLLTPLPTPTTTERRLAMFPTEGLPVEKPITIRWDEHQIPFVEAESDADGAFGLGMVHAHLRLGQMTLAKHLTQGWMAELAGPIAIDFDKAIRTIDLGRATPEIYANLPMETKQWLDRFVDGVNAYQDRMVERPHEFQVFGIDEPEPWTGADILTIGRLAGVDINWLGWVGLMQQRQREDWPAVWDRIQDTGLTTIAADGSRFGDPSESAGLAKELLVAALLDSGRIGSNSMVIDGSRTASGAPVIASDPHLGLRLPNLWLLAGLKSPSFHVVGMMPTGLPIFGLGRNPDAAWGGTNLRGASSDLIDLNATGYTEADFKVETKPLKVRWWPDTESNIRVSPQGPIISDAPLLGFDKDRPLAVRWVGHEQTDEITAFLNAARAKTWQGFADAFASYGVSAQNMLFAGRNGQASTGEIGLVVAATMPRRKPGRPADYIVTDAEALKAWDNLAPSDELPRFHNPPSGILASANVPPGPSEIPLGYVFSGPDRVERQVALAAERNDWNVSRLMSLQLDTFSVSGLAFRDDLIARIDGLEGLELTPRYQRLIEAIRAWDGRYDVESEGAAAYAALFAAMAPRLFEATGRMQDYSLINNGGNSNRWTAEVLGLVDDATLQTALLQSLEAAETAFTSYPRWGDMHRVNVGHLMSNIPLIGGKYVVGNYPVAGSHETIWKSAHPLTPGKHNAYYGSQSRHVSDLSDVDANYFVLVGGQDGWLNSANFSDQTEDFLSGQAIQLPLSDDGVRRVFTTSITLTR
ncbi:MAG: penicillin acylase family protein [Alphaproteobacteria bacterium]|nr:penicillin acylase family protein [Alphaproteobacteria bacterium SS10]